MPPVPVVVPVLQNRSPGPRYGAHTDRIDAHRALQGTHVAGDCRTRGAGRSRAGMAGSGNWPAATAGTAVPGVCWYPTPVSAGRAESQRPRRRRRNRRRRPLAGKRRHRRGRRGGPGRRIRRARRYRRPGRRVFRQRRHRRPGRHRAGRRRDQSPIGLALNGIGSLAGRRTASCELLGNQGDIRRMATDPSTVDLHRSARPRGRRCAKRGASWVKPVPTVHTCN
ncbi:hypothetical protein LAUMK7_05568 [Mycobacterium kansasii]|uniref:Uncharacterized protein n=1 Tax=Mycobacterium kansasii TaxID=1768 RepID=A0A653EFP6_MYCKA|nr:hypothetical protein MKANGN_55190 [Mycobacterium kansasii]VAZ63108.1 hypothetical protein LAUMK22_04939 [Mycobacterium kansasii]VAZ69529.1 hypothetical protein LAUMK40_05692 [Mycobacterium kansasii]VAZ80894.1 hypothetical protein LAUMK7_05568 [Mycobacterium kansasii]VTO96142.1 hypothetical protein BIN_B_00243 [Mycobacterium kansasii]